MGSRIDDALIAPKFPKWCAPSQKSLPQKGLKHNLPGVCRPAVRRSKREDRNLQRWLFEMPDRDMDGGQAFLLCQLNCLAQHFVVDVDIALRRAEVLVTGERHDDLGADAAVGELGDERPPAAVGRATIDAGALI